MKRAEGIERRSQEEGRGRKRGRERMKKKKKEKRGKKRRRRKSWSGPKDCLIGSTQVHGLDSEESNR